MNIIYAILSSVLLPRLRFLGNLQGQSYPLIGLSCLYGIWMLMSGAYISLDSINIAVFSYCLWMITSILWAEKPYALMEIILWISYFIIFIAGRQTPILTTMIIIGINPIIVAVQQIYKILIKKKTTAYEKFPIFGNSNWNGSFLLIGFYVMLWFTFNVSYLFLILAGLIGIAIILTKCRGAILGLLISFSLYSIVSINIYLISMLIGLLILSIIYGKRFLETLKGKHLLDRWVIYKDAFKKIHPKWLIGRGMNYFRDTTYGRVHNDHLEIIGELGFIGYMLFLNIFWQANLPLLVICMVISIFIAGMFFYPFREVPLVVPFWLMVGTFSNTTTSNFWMLKITSIVCILFVMVFIFTIYSNLLNKLFGKKNV